MVIVIGNGQGDTNSSAAEAVRILYSINTLGKGLSPKIIPPAIGK